MSNRADRITTIHKVLKKHFEPVAPPSDRKFLEHVLYACCLENSHFEAADEAFAKLQSNYFDWNEVRVTTVRELTGTLGCLRDPSEAAHRLKKALQSIFETHYTFELDFLSKQGLGKTLKELEKLPLTPFGLAYVTQNALAGHSIPVNAAVFEIMQILGVITESEAAKGLMPGLERAIPKAKGTEFFALLHRLSVDYGAGPTSTKVRNILAEIDPESRDRMPKKKKEEPAKPKRPRPEGAPPKPAAAKPETKAAPGAEPKKVKKPMPGKVEADDKADKLARQSPTKKLVKKKPK